MENKPRILIVEEDVRLAQALSCVLRTNGYDVAAAYDVEEAVDHITTRPVELVFISSTMFTRNGVESYTRITGIKPEVDVVVIMESRLNQGLMTHIIEQSLWAPLCKPFTVDELLAVIEDSMRFKTAALFIPVAQGRSESTLNRMAA